MLGLGVEQGVFDRAQCLRDHAAGRGPRRREQLRIDPLVLKRVLPDHAHRKALDRRADAGRAETLVEFAPADDTVVRRELDEMVVSPAGIAGKKFDAFYFGALCHDVSFCSFLSRAASPAVATEYCCTV